jgi:putative tryptophan/tyrosine transport system substrate-binding protein
MTVNIGRRELLAALGGAAAAWPLAVRAQQAAMPVIGILGGQSAQTYAPFLEPFRLGLNEMGYREGHNLAIETRWAQGRYDRLPDLADVLVSKRVALIFAVGATEAALAAKSATSTIPIVFANGSDPVKSGLVVSLNRPGGNLTGTTFYSAGLAAKRLELLHELVPNARVIAVLVQSGSVLAEEQETGLEKAADALGLRLLVLPVSGERDLEPTFAKLAAERAGALVVTAAAFFTSQREKIVALAAQSRIPAIYPRQEHAVAGGLISYAANVAHVYRRAGVYVGLVLNGAKPADLPVELPTKFELVINLKVAKALGVAIPDKLLALADEVIE